MEDRPYNEEIKIFDRRKVREEVANRSIVKRYYNSLANHTRIRDGAINQSWNESFFFLFISVFFIYLLSPYLRIFHLICTS